MFCRIFTISKMAPDKAKTPITECVSLRYRRTAVGRGREAGGGGGEAAITVRRASFGRVDHSRRDLFLFFLSSTNRDGGHHTGVVRTCRFVEPSRIFFISGTNRMGARGENASSSSTFNAGTRGSVTASVAARLARVHRWHGFHKQKRART